MLLKKVFKNRNKDIYIGTHTQLADTPIIYSIEHFLNKLSFQYMYSWDIFSHSQKLQLKVIFVKALNF